MCRGYSYLVCSFDDVYLGSGKTELFSESSIQSSVAQRLFKANLINEVHFDAAAVLLTEVVSVELYRSFCTGQVIGWKRSPK